MRLPLYYDTSGAAIRDADGRFLTSFTQEKPYATSTDEALARQMVAYINQRDELQRIAEDAISMIAVPPDAPPSIKSGIDSIVKHLRERLRSAVEKTEKQ